MITQPPHGCDPPPLLPVMFPRFFYRGIFSEQVHDGMGAGSTRAWRVFSLLWDQPNQRSHSMHAHGIVQRFIESHLSVMHAARRRVLSQAVAAVVAGHYLSLSRIARSLSGSIRLKAAAQAGGSTDRTSAHRAGGALGRGAAAGAVEQAQRATDHCGGLVAGEHRGQHGGVACGGELPGDGASAHGVSKGLSANSAWQRQDRARIARPVAPFAPGWVGEAGSLW